MPKMVRKKTRRNNTNIRIDFSTISKKADIFEASDSGHLDSCGQLDNKAIVIGMPEGLPFFQCEGKK